MKSLRARLSVFLLGAAMVLAIALGLLTYWQTLRENEDLFDYHLRQTALSLREHGAVDALADLPDEDAVDVVVQIWNENGAILYLSRPGTGLPDQATLGFSDVEANGQRWRVFSMASNGRVIQVAQPVLLRRELAAAAALRSLRPLLAFIPLMAALIWGIVGGALHPLKRLEREVTQRDAGALDAVSEEGLPSEIAPVAEALNSLLLRLDQAFLGQRAFIADAAHELRSPLTALKLQLQSLEKADGDDERRLALARLHEGVDRASRLIEQLLTAARTEPGEGPVTFAQVDLPEAMRLVIADLFPIASERGTDIELDAPEHLSIDADSHQLRILMRNLVDNAVRYTPANGTIRIGIAEKQDRALLVVEDSGPGIPEADRGEVFRRFFRGQTGTGTGSGLGLSIVKNIVDRHHGSIELGTASLGGLRVEVGFPMRQRGSRPA